MLLIENIKILINYKNLNINEIFESVCDSDAYNNLTFLNDIKNGVSEYSETLNNVFSTNLVKCGFDNLDIEYLKGFFSVLGKTDTQGQLLNCDLYKSLFEKKYLQLEFDEKSKCKITPTLIFCCGFFFLIVTI